MDQEMQIHDVLNDLTIWGDIFPRKLSENAIIANNIRHLPEDSLTVFDITALPYSQNCKTYLSKHRTSKA